MEDENCRTKISSETLNRIVLVIVDLVTIVYADIVNNNASRGSNIKQEGKIIKLIHIYLLSELEKLTFDYLYRLLLNKKYRDFITEFSLYSNTSFSFCDDLKKINTILLTLKEDKIHKIYKIVKLITMTAQEKNENKNISQDIKRMPNLTEESKENETNLKLSKFGRGEIKFDKLKKETSIQADNGNFESKCASKKDIKPNLLGHKHTNDYTLEESIKQIENSSSPSSIKNNIELNFNSNVRKEIINFPENVLFQDPCTKDENKSTSTQSTKNKTYSTVQSINCLSNYKQPEVGNNIQNNNNITFNNRINSSASSANINPFRNLISVNTPSEIQNKVVSEKNTQQTVKYKEKLINSAKLFQLTAATLSNKVFKSGNVSK